jgi:hypothetical protein
MKLIDFYIPHFPVGEIYQLNLILGDDRPNVVALVKFGDIELFGRVLS